MIENNPTNVVAAFEMLLEELETEIDLVNKVGSKAFEARNYDRAREVLERAAKITAFRDKVASSRKEWEVLATGRQFEDEDKEIHAEKRNLGRLKRGLRTPEQEFYRPILSALIKMGGSGKVKDVLKRVEDNMKGTLRKCDYEPLSSNRDTLRWDNTARWARNSMISDGLLKNDSAHGVWEISEAGRRFLQGNKG